MTAAVAPPPLFTHLVASRPAREKGSVTATIASVAVHAALILCAILLSARVREPPPAEVIRPVVLPNPIVATPRTDPAPPAGGTGGGRALRALPLPMPPNAIPSFIPKPGQLPFEELPDYVPPSTKPGPGNSDLTTRQGGGEFGEFVPYTVKPELLNRIEVARLLQRYYPSNLLQAGIGGEVVVWLQVEVTGAVVQTRISKSSQRKELDDAALRVAEAMRFSPAYNRDQKVKVWVELPIIFGAR